MPLMPALTRRRSTDAREECWHIYYGDVQAGTIAIRIGNPQDEDPLEWYCGFYPGSSGRTSERHRRDLRRGPRRFRIRMAGVFIEAHRGRFSGIRAVGRWQAALIAPRTATGWKRPFDEPIRLSRGGKLVTLEDAGDYITELPKVDHTAADW